MFHVFFLCHISPTISVLSLLEIRKKNIWRKENVKWNFNEEIQIIRNLNFLYYSVFIFQQTAVLSLILIILNSGFKMTWFQHEIRILWLVINVIVKRLFTFLRVYFNAEISDLRTDVPVRHDFFLNFLSKTYLIIYESPRSQEL